MQTGRIDTRILIASCSVVFFTELAGSLVIVYQNGPVLPVIGLVRIIEISLIILIIFRMGDGPATIGFFPETFLKKLRRGLFWSAGFGCIAGLVMLFLQMAGIYPLTSFKIHLHRTPMNLVFFFLVGGLIGPIAEEIFFRGILYTFLRRWGIFLAVAGSTFIFSLAHYFTGHLQPTQIIGGLVFAMAFETENHLIVPMAIHVLGNLAIFTIGMLV